MGLGRQQNFSGDAVLTTLTSEIDSSSLTFDVSSVAGWPSSGLPFTVTLDQGNPTLQETVLVVSYSGLTATVDSDVGRGYDSTTAQSHAEDATVVHTLDAAWCADVSARLFATTTKGDIPIVSATDGVVMGRLPISDTEFQVVGAGASGLPAYQDSSKSTLSTLGDLLYASAAHVLSRLGIGTTGEVLTVVDGVPAWGAPSGLQPIDKSSSYVAAASDYAVASASLTVTSPAAAKGASFGAIANYAASNASPVTLTAATGNIIGPGIPASTTSIILGAQSAFAVLTSDGTNWFVTAGAQDSGWIAPSLTNSWTSLIAPAYRLRANEVMLRGEIASGSSGTSAFTLPVGYRPATADTASPIGTGTGSAFVLGFLNISTAGAVVVSFFGSVTLVSLDGVIFTVD